MELLEQTTGKMPISSIKEKLKKSTLGDNLWKRILGWFDRSQKEDIPASSILELYCTAQDYKALICLVFQLFVKCTDDNEREILKEKLKYSVVTLLFNGIGFNHIFPASLVNLTPLSVTLWCQQCKIFTLNGP